MLNVFFLLSLSLSLPFTCRHSIPICGKYVFEAKNGWSENGFPVCKVTDVDVDMEYGRNMFGQNNITEHLIESLMNAQEGDEVATTNTYNRK